MLAITEIKSLRNISGHSAHPIPERKVHDGIKKQKYPKQIHQSL